MVEVTDVDKDWSLIKQKLKAFVPNYNDLETSIKNVNKAITFVVKHFNNKTDDVIVTTMASRTTSVDFDEILNDIDKDINNIDEKESNIENTDDSDYDAETIKFIADPVCNAFFVCLFALLLQQFEPSMSFMLSICLILIPHQRNYNTYQ